MKCNVVHKRKYYWLPINLELSYINNIRQNYKILYIYALWGKQVTEKIIFLIEQ